MGTTGPAGLREREALARPRVAAGAEGLREREDDAPLRAGELGAFRVVRREAPRCVDVVRAMS
jgi:hypothetical protein